MKLIKIENVSQKAFLALATTMSIIGIFLHNPLGSYNIPVITVEGVPCNDREKSAYKNELEGFKRSGIKFTEYPADDDKYIEGLVQGCLTPTTDEYASISEWQSRDPIIGWFGKVLNILTYLITMIAIGISGIYIFKPSETK